MIRYGNQIGRKFNEDGSPRRYPGNTVIADVRPNCAAYDAMMSLKAIARTAGLENSLILMPEDSYHMTVIRGLNDLVRSDAYWPNKLPKDAPMTEADDYVQNAFESAGLPEKIRMRFCGVRVNEEDFRVLVAPADGQQEKELRAFRDRAASALGLFLPGHAEYTYHITLAYTRIVPQGAQKDALERAVTKMEALLRTQKPFKLTPPYVAFYQDMLSFSTVRIPRDDTNSLPEGADAL